jgi:hypothetical protein
VKSRSDTHASPSGKANPLPQTRIAPRPVVAVLEKRRIPRPSCIPSVSAPGLRGASADQDDGRGETRKSFQDFFCMQHKSIVRLLSRGVYRHFE